VQHAAGSARIAAAPCFGCVVNKDFVDSVCRINMLLVARPDIMVTHHRQNVSGVAGLDEGEAGACVQLNL